MRKMAVLILICFALATSVQTASAVPMDLSGFTGDPGVSEAPPGTVNFTEQPDSFVIYFYNDFYEVTGNNVILSFDYSFTLGANDSGDYFFLELKGDPDHRPFEVSSTSSGQFEINLTPYLNQDDQVSIAWGLMSGETESIAGSYAILSNIDVSAASVPEPGAIMLLGSGLAGMALLRWRKFSG